MYLELFAHVFQVRTGDILDYRNVSMFQASKHHLKHEKTFGGAPGILSIVCFT